MESEYGVMVNVTCEIVWVRDLLNELSFTPECPMRSYYNNQTAIHIAKNLVFHKCTKYIKVNCHLVC